MLNTTTNNFDGKEIKEYLGVVTGEAISGANFVKDLMAKLRDFTGGRSGAYEQELSKARNIAFDEMNHKAMEMGANGGVGIDIPVVFGKPLSNTFGNKPFTSPSTWFIIFALNCSEVTYL